MKHFDRSHIRLDNDKEKCIFQQNFFQMKPAEDKPNYHFYNKIAISSDKWFSYLKAASKN